ncbi:MAG TPA: benzoyl-CoA reductase [Dehalococcoidia bacterium]|nr:benzoyl-CoA reductase [Dehalococcoidia bacterium]
MSVMDEFHEMVSSPHEFARDWKKETGGKVLGYMCSNVPEELIYSTGVLPIRLLGSNEPEDVTKPYIFQAGYCSFARDCFAQALQGRYDYIDGITYSACCPHIAEVYYDWQRYVPVSFAYQLHLPTNLQGKHSKKYLTGELEDFKRSLEEWVGKGIHLDRFDNAVKIYNRNRHLMAEIYELLKDDEQKITAAEAAEIAISGMLMDKERHNQMLEQAINEIRAREGSGNNGPRIMLLGSVNNNIEVISFIESLGAHVVVDDYCTGRRYYQTDVNFELNRIAALASRLMEKPPCPLKDLPERRRPGYYADIIDNFRVEGAIYTFQRLCDPHGLDYPVIEKTFTEKGVPMLKLELDYNVPVGQLRTRTEAFLEMLQSF